MDVYTVSYDEGKPVDRENAVITEVSDSSMNLRIGLSIDGRNGLAHFDSAKRSAILASFGVDDSSALNGLEVTALTQDRKVAGLGSTKKTPWPR